MHKTRFRGSLLGFFEAIEKQDPNYTNKHEIPFLAFFFMFFPIHAILWNFTRYPGQSGFELAVNVIFESLLYLPVILIVEPRIGRFLERWYTQAGGILFASILVLLSLLYFLIAVPSGFIVATASITAMDGLFIPSTNWFVNLAIAYGIVFLLSAYGSIIAGLRGISGGIAALWRERRSHKSIWSVLAVVMIVSPLLVQAIGLGQFWFVGPPVILLAFILSQNDKLKSWREGFNYADLFALAHVALLLLFAYRISFFSYIPLVLIASILFYHPAMKPLNRAHFYYTFSPNRKDIVSTLVAMGLLSVTFLPLAIATGFLNVNDFTADVTAIDLLGNGLLFLFKVAVGEEVVFRCLLMTLLANTLKHVKRLKAWSRFLSLVITSIIFGLGHAHGGWGYVLVATIAGFVYGYVFLYQQSLFGVIILYAVVDTIAFCFFHAIANS